MDKPKQEPVANVNVMKRPDGAWWFAMTYRGVTHPLTGPFRNQMEAAAAAQSAVKKLESHRG